MDRLRVRVYDVRFGDAILISAPDRAPTGETTIRHILVDFGNVLTGEGGQDAVFQPVIEDILQQLGGRPLDLYVMTHEHLDHVQGLLYADEKILPEEDLSQKLNVHTAWLTASSEPGYYEAHPNAKKKLEAAHEIYAAIASFLAASPGETPEPLHTLMLNNNPRATADCVDYIRSLAQNTFYVHREFDANGKHPFNEVEIELWAPEEDTSDYYGSFQPMALGVTQGVSEGDPNTLQVPIPPPGVDAGAFYNLVDSRRGGFVDNLLAIDRASNNTSIVFCLQWRGWRLLFPGDAEVRSWRTMEREGVLQPVHFLKIGHHGSHNGTPPPEILDKILPEDGQERHAVLSTFPGTYDNVPDEATLEELRQRCTLHSVLELQAGQGFLDIEFEGEMRS